MPPVKTRQTPLGREVLIVLRDRRPAAADRRRVVARFGECVGHAPADALVRTPNRTECRGVENGLSVGRLPKERFDIRYAQSIRTAVRCAHNVEIPASRVRIAAAEVPHLSKVFRHVDVQCLHNTEGVVLVDPVLIGRFTCRRVGEGLLNRQRIQVSANGVVGHGERRLSGKLPRD